MNQRIPNPECRDGKHSNCDGHGWDIDADTAVRCPCACHHEMFVDHKIIAPMRRHRPASQLHPQASDIVTAEGLRHIDHCDQCRQTFNVIGRIAYTEDELTDHSDTYTI